MKIGEVWISKSMDEYCRLRIFDKVDSETWIVEVLDCSPAWHDWFYLVVEAIDEGDYDNVTSMKFILGRIQIVEFFVKEF